MPIINPWIFYLAYSATQVTNIVGMLSFVVVLFSGTALLVCYCALNIGDLYEDERDTVIRGRRVSKRIFMISLSIFVICCLIPDRQTILLMYGSSMLTPDNIQVVQAQLIEFVRQLGGN